MAHMLKTPSALAELQFMRSKACFRKGDFVRMCLSAAPKQTIGIILGLLGLYWDN